MVAPVSERFLSLSFPQRKTAERRKDYFIKDCPLVDWQNWTKAFSPAEAARPPIFEFAGDGKVWLKDSPQYTRRPKEAPALDRTFRSFLAAGKPGLAALTMVLGLEWQLPSAKGSRLANREEIFTVWLKQLAGDERGALAAEGFDLTLDKIFQLMTGQLTLEVGENGRFGEMFSATRTIAASGQKSPAKIGFEFIDPFYVSELGAYYYAGAGLAELGRQQPEKALAAFRLSSVIAPEHTVIDKLIGEKVKAGLLPRF